VPVLLRGGFTSSSRSAFVVLAALALVAAMLADDEATSHALRSPPVLCLISFSGLTALSAAWAIDGGGDAIQWGLVVAGYGALAAAVAGAGIDVRLIAGAIVALAAIEAALGIAAVAVREEPLAQRLGGSWQGGGSFEYAPALALLQVSALPAALRAMCAGRGALAIVGAFASLLAAMALALADSRLALLLAAAVMALALAAPRRTVGAGTAAALAAAALLVAAGLAAHLISGRFAFPDATGGDAGRLAALAGVLAVALACWPALRARLQAGGGERSAPAGRRGRLALAAAACLGALAIAVAAASEPGGARPGVEGSSGVGGGRGELWSAAIDAGLERPLAGAGAETYLPATAADQEAAPVLYAHELPLEALAELGILGLALVLALYGTAAALLWRIRGRPEAWLLGPAVAAFLVANLVDWPWHLAGAGAVWALALGGCIAAARYPLRPT
jgi:hypothetical protein